MISFQLFNWFKLKVHVLQMFQVKICDLRSEIQVGIEECPEQISNFGVLLIRCTFKQVVWIE